MHAVPAGPARDRRPAGRRPAGPASPSASTASSTTSTSARAAAGSAATPGSAAVTGSARNSSSTSGQIAVERGLHPGVRQLGAVAEPDHPLRRVVAVVGQLLDALGRDRGQHRVGASRRAARTAPAARSRRPAAGRRARRSRRPPARPAGRCGTPARRGRTPAGPRPGRPRPRGPPGPAASGPGRAGRARCWRARSPPPARAARVIHCCSRWEKISASSPSIRQYAASASASTPVGHGRVDALQRVGEAGAERPAVVVGVVGQSPRRPRTRPPSGRRSAAPLHVRDVVGDVVERRVPVHLVAGRGEERVLLVRAGRGDVARPRPPRC